ncbi:MAG: acetoacetate decarboxylase family protein [Deltaproteobacteria bacterium]|nr:acetoacetate decarboxylase family protein [Deltaproteobacteria bacterium]MBW2447349.1 acetoacetate decarboxylase family protein [Deltaproteobacteria bacterium]
MARLRWVKTLDEVKSSKDSNPEFLSSTVRSIRTVFETDPEVVKAVLPKPLEPCERPEGQLTTSQVTIHINPEFKIEIGSAIFGVNARYDGQEGLYLLTMPMTTESAVVGGRETFGEPKKIADIGFDFGGGASGDAAKGDALSATVTRMGIPYMEVNGTVGEETGEREFSEFAWCIKANPSCEPGQMLDHDPLLVRLEWKHKQSRSARMEGEITLRESPFDPVADVPVRRIVRMGYEEGNTESNGRVLRSIPADWFLPFLHGRYDEPGVEGIEV